MRVIITGGTGLIGGALARSLAQDGHEVVVLSRNPERYRDQLPDGVTAEAWDGKTASGWGDLASGAGAIVNLAGENLSSRRWTAKQKHRIIESRVNAGKAVTAAVETADPKPGVVIQSSGVDYYDVHNPKVKNVDSPPGSDYLSQVAIEWENSTATVAAMGVRRAIIRSGVVLSTQSGALPRLMLPFKLFVGGPVGSGQQYLSWIHLQDEVDAIRFIIDHEQAVGPFNLATPHPVTNREFGQTLARVMKRPFWMPVPAFTLKLALGEMSTIVLNGQRVLPSRLESLGFRFNYPELEQALRNILQKRILRYGSLDRFT